MSNHQKEHFSLKISCKIAEKAIKDKIAPLSIILSQLFFMQKSNVFPKHLDIDFFKQNSYSMNDSEKKLTIFLLEEFKKPNVDIYMLLVNNFKDNWAFKKVEINKNYKNNKPNYFKTEKNKPIIVKKSNSMN